MISLWNAIIYKPLYNVLIFLIAILPGHSVGGAIILLTLFVKILLYPLTGKSIIAQRQMRELEPELKLIRDKHKDDKQKQAKLTMELYQKHKVTPLSGCLPILIQIPIIIGLYWVFLKGLQVIDTSILFSFISAPATLDMHFLVFDLASKSIFLALLAGVTQFIQTHISLGKQPPLSPASPGKASFQEDFARSMQVQMRYILPIMIGFTAYTTAGAVALYWATSNILSIIQELLMRPKEKIGQQKSN
jgi:YidC/Oxa1 family membrane protein insertase